MNNNEVQRHIRRLSKIIVICFILLTFFIIALATVGTIEIAKLNSSVYAYNPDTLNAIQKELKAQRSQKITVINGVDGKDGEDGLDGKNGKNGINAVSTNTTIEKDINTVTIQEKQIPGPQGDPGQDGTNGKQIELAIDGSTGQLLQRYQGNSIWLPVPTVNTEN